MPKCRVTVRPGDAQINGTAEAATFLATALIYGAGFMCADVKANITDIHEAPCEAGSAILIAATLYPGEIHHKKPVDLRQTETELTGVMRVYVNNIVTLI